MEDEQDNDAMKMFGVTSIPNSPKMKTFRTLYKYGLTVDTYLELFNKQKSKCSICTMTIGSHDRNVFVDHDHETGKVRGILCCRCNHLLGMADDEIEILENAIEYLKRNNNG